MIKYEIKSKIVNCEKIESETSHDLYPLPCHKLSHFLRPLPPLERDILYGRPLHARPMSHLKKVLRIKSTEWGAVEYWHCTVWKDECPISATCQLNRGCGQTWYESRGYGRT